jgi:hypothetical protein
MFTRQQHQLTLPLAGALAWHVPSKDGRAHVTYNRPINYSGSPIASHKRANDQRRGVKA